MHVIEFVAWLAAELFAMLDLHHSQAKPHTHTKGAQRRGRDAGPHDRKGSNQ